MSNVTSEADPQALRVPVAGAQGLAMRCQREDLALRIGSALARLDRPDTVIAVVGEFKQGKSSVVNGLLGMNVCPVDDDIATAVPTVFRYGENPRLRVVIDDADGSQRVLEADIEDLDQFVLEPAGLQRHHTRLAEVDLPASLLSRGIVVIDTPGVGGLDPGHLSTTLGYLRIADAALVVSDAASPVSKGLLEFLREATAVCPIVALVMPRTDLFRTWRDMSAHVSGQLSAHGLGVPVFPVSTTLRMAAFETSDADLNRQSGFPALFEHVRVGALEPRAASALAFAEAEAGAVLSLLQSSLSEEANALNDDRQTPGRIAELEVSRSKLDRLRADGARWSLVLNDGFADAATEADHNFRQSMRSLARTIEEQIEATEPLDTWDEMSNRLRDCASRSAAEAFETVHDRAARVAAQIATLISDESDGLVVDSPVAMPGTTDAVLATRPFVAPGVTGYAGTTWAGMRGAQGGILVVGMMASLAGIGIGALALAGVGLAFGTKQVFEERKRRVQARRQAARQAVRQFLDDVQFEVNKSLRDLVRDLQRTQRDYFGQRMTEVSRTLTTSVEALQKTLHADGATREERRQTLGGLADEATKLAAALGVQR